ncbi:hypothetical protein D3C80_1632890 [compost metagenome]
MRKHIRLRFEHHHSRTLRDYAIERRVAWGTVVCQSQQLITRHSAGGRQVLGRDFKRHIYLLHTLLKRGLVKGGGIAGFAQQYPHCLHGRCAWAEQN